LILIYTHTITPRINYTIDLIFSTVLNCPYKLTNDILLYKESILPKIAYTNENKGFDVYLKSDILLFETNIKNELPSSNELYLNLPQFFSTSNNSFLPYDLFATVFYFATRYEEYLPHESDKHQRFQAEKGLSFNYQILNKPFLNILIQDFATKLKLQFPQLKFKQRTFNFLSTIDIDNAFAYANKGFKRNVGGVLKDITSFRFNQVANRIKSNINSHNDPYNTFEFINSLSEESKTTLQYFVLIGDYSDYDKNPHYQNKGFRYLLKSLSLRHSMGLHPSYESFNNLEKISIEKKRLEDVIEKKVTSARCHFLRINFPETYRAFIKAGITDDYTMIYASQSGFRTGLCVPYTWFDLQKNEVTNLTIHPSAVMEGTLRDYNKLLPTQAIEVINELMQEVKNNGGEFVSIWHNDSFATNQQKWIDVYKIMLSV
jgi:hypothetical protein